MSMDLRDFLAIVVPVLPAGAQWHVSQGGLWIRLDVVHRRRRFIITDERVFFAHWVSSWSLTAHDNFALYDDSYAHGDPDQQLYHLQRATYALTGAKASRIKPLSEDNELLQL